MSILDQNFQGSTSCGGSCDIFKIRKDPVRQDASLTTADRQKQKQIEEVLSEALNGLTFHERQEQQEVLHGVEDEILEETSSVDNALKDLDCHLLRRKPGTVYETAESMSPEYVNSRAFRLMFLRGNRYDSKASASQMIRYFEAKEQLFGKEKLTKDITLDDFDDDDIEALKKGGMQLAGRDRSNRRIFFQVPGLRAYKTLTNELRSRYYIFMQALRSEATQLKGVVAITYTVDHFGDKAQGAGFLDHMRLSTALPLHIASFHACGSVVAEHLLGQTAIAMMPAKLKARFRMHCGSFLEVQYLLSTFGISADQLPLTQVNEIDMSRHLEWVQSRLPLKGNDARTAVTAPTLPRTIEPNTNDVLYIGGIKSNNKGNNRLRSLVPELAQDYVSAPTGKKTLVVDRMIREIHDSGGRFLQQSNGVWNELPIEKVRSKISQSFRNHKSKRDASSRKKVLTGTLITGEPLPTDVIFGRSQRSGGNDLLYLLIKERAHEYDALDRGKKQAVVDAVVQRIKGDGGRFLQPTGDYGGWLELSNEASREKVSRYFRNYRRQPKKAVQ
ncbi:MAG: hypothetical protein SGBAC_011908 [Bacillariaceae sp.]